MRIIKLAAFALLGYLLYELYETYGGPREWQRQRAGGRDLHRALNRDAGRMMNMTGPGRGSDESTQDFSGGSSHHRVGRGVV